MHLSFNMFYLQLAPLNLWVRNKPLTGLEMNHSLKLLK